MCNDGEKIRRNGLYAVQISCVVCVRTAAVAAVAAATPSACVRNCKSTYIHTYVKRALDISMRRENVCIRPYVCVCMYVCTFVGIYNCGSYFCERRSDKGCLLFVEEYVYNRNLRKFHPRCLPDTFCKARSVIFILYLRMAGDEWQNLSDESATMWLYEDVKIFVCVTFSIPVQSLC